MATANFLWGAPRIYGELLKLGITVSERTVSRYLLDRLTTRSQTWRTFLANHIGSLAITSTVTPNVRVRRGSCPASRSSRWCGSRVRLGGVRSFSAPYTRDERQRKRNAPDPARFLRTSTPSGSSRSKLVREDNRGTYNQRS